MPCPAQMLGEPVAKPAKTPGESNGQHRAKKDCRARHAVPLRSKDRLANEQRHAIVKRGTKLRDPPVRFLCAY